MSGSKLLKVDRHLRILERLRKEGAGLRIRDLGRELDVSPVTIRRDVMELTRQGMVSWTRGGVKLLQEGTRFEPQYETKLGEDADLKEEMAKVAVGLLPDAATVFLDGGTTVGAMAHLVSRRNLTVITNALNVANMVANSKTARLIFIGGTFRPTSQTFLGPKAISALRELRFDIACMGTEGFDPHRGGEVPDESDAEFKTTAIGLAGKVLMLSTSSKCGKPRLYRFAEWADIDTVILGGSLPSDTLELIAAQGVEIVQVAEAGLTSPLTMK